MHTTAEWRPPNRRSPKGEGAREKEGSGREDTAQSPSGGREKVLEASTDTFGGSTMAEDFSCSGAAWNLQDLMTGAGGAGPTCRRGLRPSEVSRP
jgi:hypothetical protein